jgi:hypothetical protein
MNLEEIVSTVKRYFYVDFTTINKINDVRDFSRYIVRISFQAGAIRTLLKARKDKGSVTPYLKFFISSLIVKPNYRLRSCRERPVSYG